MGRQPPRVFNSNYLFCLRGGEEHRNLKPSQLQREIVTVESRSLVQNTYTEYVSKNRAGGLKQIKQASKVRIHQYRGSDMCRCHVLFGPPEVPYIVFTFAGSVQNVRNDVYIYIYNMSTTWRTQCRYIIFRLYFGKIHSFPPDFISEESFRPEEFFDVLF